MLRELSTCIIKQFNDQEILKKNLERKQAKPHIPINIVQEPTFDLDKPVFCYFCPEIHMAYRSYIEKFRNGSRYVTNATVRQCYFRNNFFIKSEEKMNHDISVCAATEGITYYFDNAKITTSICAMYLLLSISILRQLQEMLVFLCENVCSQLLYDSVF